MICGECELWSETTYNNDGISRIDYCPLCGAELDEVGWIDDEDDEAKP